ncbi:pentapeptide repeat-containing protein [candidate division KSB1 bacterium]|nr:pentapeptide repeat-containing protein [candidate division KSB1 bacterium]
MADFKVAQFESRANFRDAIFDSLADFRKAKFPSGADFEGTQFRRESSGNQQVRAGIGCPTTRA